MAKKKDTRMDKLTEFVKKTKGGTYTVSNICLEYDRLPAYNYVNSKEEYTYNMS